MRLLIKAATQKPCFIPFNYQYQLHAAIYQLIGLSSRDYSTFLHDTGFRMSHKVPQGAEQELGISLKRFKLFTFSKLKFFPYRRSRYGFKDVKSVEFIFSTPVSKSLEHLVYGLFAGQNFKLTFKGKAITFYIQHVESLSEKNFPKKEKFLCLSPISITTTNQLPTGKLQQHFLDYMNPEEKEKFQLNLYNNLVRKYETLYQKSFQGDQHFEFAFDSDYILKRHGKISKLIKFKHNVNIRGFEAPFQISADPALIKIGYDCGFGDKNSAGFGCVEKIG